MDYLKYNCAVILFLTINCYASINAFYPDNNHGKVPPYAPYQLQPQAQQYHQHQQQHQHPQYLRNQQQQQQQQQQYGQGLTTRATNLNIILPKATIEDFEYIPTVQGYLFNYQLLDGTRREENAFITGLRMDNYSRLDSKTTDFTAVGVGGRPKMALKNRKLSPGALKSLSG